jgi:hypothetical protein
VVVSTLIDLPRTQFPLATQRMKKLVLAKGAGPEAEEPVTKETKKCRLQKTFLTIEYLIRIMNHTKRQESKSRNKGDYKNSKTGRISRLNCPLLSQSNSLLNSAIHKTNSLYLKLSSKPVTNHRLKLRMRTKRLKCQAGILICSIIRKTSSLMRPLC